MSAAPWRSTRRSRKTLAAARLAGAAEVHSKVFHTTNSESNL